MEQFQKFRDCAYSLKVSKPILLSQKSQARIPGTCIKLGAENR